MTCSACGTKIPQYDAAKTAIGFDAAIAQRKGAIEASGRYRVIKSLGAGQFGEVWLADDVVMERQVAIKAPRRDELDWEETERVHREYRAAGQLDHPNIVRVYHVEESRDLIFMVSEVIHGKSLKEWLVENPPTPRVSAKICMLLADALQHADDAGVTHRDLKPGNVLMDRADLPHLTDFGIARRQGVEITMTEDGRILGTPAYMSPEQARGHARFADRRSDVYSLGVMLFEMLTGQLPFCGSTKTLVLHQILTADPINPRRMKAGIPRDLETICLKAIAREPIHRYQSAREMGEDLRRFLDQKPILARRTSIVGRFWRWSCRNPSLVCSAAVVSLLLFFGVFQSLNLHRVEAMIQPMIKRDEESTRKLKSVLQKVTITTEPPGATVLFVPLHSSSGEPQPKLAVQTNGESAELFPGNYLVIAYADSDHFNEVFRRVPIDVDDMPHAFPHGFWKKRSDGIELKPVKIFDQSVSEGMCCFDGSDDFLVGSATLPEVPRHHRRVPSFYLDTREVTVGEWKQWTEEKGFGLHPKIKESATSDDTALSYVSWDRAVAYAESVGKRLPDEIEYEFAATYGGQRAAPWGDDLNQIGEWRLGSIGICEFDRLETSPPIVGLYSNVAEWTSSWLAKYPTTDFPHMNAIDSFTDLRIVRGAPPAVIEGFPKKMEGISGPRERIGILRQHQKPGLGFRCARSRRPRIDSVNFVTPVL